MLFRLTMRLGTLFKPIFSRTTNWNTARKKLEENNGESNKRVIRKRRSKKTKLKGI
jgi:hypothetical protein